MGVNLKFLMEKVKRRNRDVSTVVLRVFLSQTFPFILLTSNSMTLLVQFKKKHALALRTRAILASLKNSLVYVISNCTRNHTITYTNNIICIGTI